MLKLILFKMNLMYTYNHCVKFHLNPINISFVLSKLNITFKMIFTSKISKNDLENIF